MGCHFLLQGIFPEIKFVSLASPALAGKSFTSEPPGKPVDLLIAYFHFTVNPSSSVRWFSGRYVFKRYKKRPHGCWGPQTETKVQDILVSAPSLTHSLATAPARRTLAPLFSIFFWDGSSPKWPFGAETSGSDEICRKITGQVNSLAPPQTLYLFSQHSLAREAAGYEGLGAHSEQNPS